MLITRTKIDQIQRIVVNEHCRYEDLVFGANNTKKYNLSIFASFPEESVKQIQQMDGYISVNDYHLKEGLIPHEIGAIGNIRFCRGKSGDCFQVLVKCDCGIIPEAKLFALNEQPYDFRAK